MARFLAQIFLPCDAAYNRTGGSGAIYCAMTFIKANIFTPVRMNAHPTMLYNLITDVHESIHRFTPVRMNAHPTMLYNLITDVHESIHRFTPVRMNAHPTVLCNLATNAHERA